MDLQASMAQGAAILTRWANILDSTGKEEQQEALLSADYAAEAAFWQSVVNEYTVKTRLMWRDGWFRDYDLVTGEWSAQQDAMHLARCSVVSQVGSTWNSYEHISRGHLLIAMAGPRSHGHPSS